MCQWLSLWVSSTVCPECRSRERERGDRKKETIKIAPADILQVFAWQNRSGQCQTGGVSSGWLHQSAESVVEIASKNPGSDGRSSQAHSELAPVSLCALPFSLCQQSSSDRTGDRTVAFNCSHSAVLLLIFFVSIVHVRYMWITCDRHVLRTMNFLFSGQCLQALSSNFVADHFV